MQSPALSPPMTPPLMPVLPALSESHPLHLTAATAMYVAQGVQGGLFFVDFPAQLAHQVFPNAAGTRQVCLREAADVGAV